MGRRRILIENATELHVAADAISNERGVILIQPGVRLTAGALDRLKKAKISSVIVLDQDLQGIATREALNSRTYAQTKACLRRITITLGRKQMIDPSDQREVRLLARSICDELASDASSFLLYTAIKDDPVDRFANHVINVALIAANVMLRLKARDHAEWLAMAALVQDLGIWLMEPSARSRYMAGQRDDPTLIRDYVRHARQLTRGWLNLSAYVRAIVAQHHEHVDGTGQPEGKKADDIHPLARVMAVVDNYVTLMGRDDDPLLPHDAIEAIMAGVGFEFDQTAFKAFQSSVHPYPIGTEVKMDTGEEGIVSGVHRHLLHRPTVRILRNAQGMRIAPFEIDMAKETTRWILQVLN